MKMLEIFMPNASIELKSNDISWKNFAIGYAIFGVVNFIFDEIFRPMQRVDLLEKVLWYIGFGATFLLIPGIPILLMRFIPSLKLNSPKKTTLMIGSALMAISLLMTAFRLTSK